MERELKLNTTLEQWNSVEEWKELKGYAKTFLSLMALSIVFVLIIGLGSYMRHEVAAKQNDNKLASVEFKQATLQSMLAEELPYYAANQQLDTFTFHKLGLWIMEKITNVSLLDPASIVASEMLYSSIEEQSTLIHGGAGADPARAPQDDQGAAYAPIDDQYLDKLLDEAEKQTGSGSPSSHEPNKSASEGGPEQEKGQHTSGEQSKPVAFIYHTHNRESWNSELKPNERDAQSSNTNITLVGQRLAEELEKRGLGSMVSDTDYPTEVPDYEWAYSYKYSRKTVREAIASNNELQYIFDLHRDSQPRKYTTAEINGNSYAQVYFIIGQRNPNWKENEAFALKIHEKLEEQYPGLSRGIWGKNANSGNAEYNQSLSNQSVLIEVGGIDNTLEECYRTAEALADVIAQIHEEEQAQ
ncbi:stage II sporulation protein P [Paenibacillus septentrionalis]|uniref:Stage II sporulation protein P n=1 Tax=Paenibacillus septentrionalis TaxID=429342 RepID=A0ABW1V3M6_9BACL